MVLKSNFKDELFLNNFSSVLSTNSIRHACLVPLLFFFFLNKQVECDHYKKRAHSPLMCARSFVLFPISPSNDGAQDRVLL